MKKFDEELLTYNDRFRDTYTHLLENLGKLIAILTAAVTALLVFTDIEFLGVTSKEFSTTLILILISSYICYFSLEEAGERLYEESDEHKERLLRYERLAGRITVSMLPALRSYIMSYTRDELEFRKGQMLLSMGLGEDDLREYREGLLEDRKTGNPNKESAPSSEAEFTEIPEEISPKSPTFKRRKSDPHHHRKLAKLRKIDRQKPLSITPEMLLSRSPKERGKIADPKSRKYPALILRIIPGTLCTFLTASVVLTFKEMTAEAIIEGVLKLSTLPIVAFRGYASGYNYKRYSEAPFIEAKIRLLEDFLSKTDT